MIKFIENNKTKLKFISYSEMTSISNLILLFLLILSLFWFLCFSPINSSLTCNKGILGQIDCQLSEKSLLRFQVTRTDIVNLKKAAIFGRSRSFSIPLKANPNSSLHSFVGFHKTYYYPSSPLALVHFRNFNPSNWFTRINQINQINNFIKDKSNSKSLYVEQSLDWITLLVVVIFIIGIPLSLAYSILVGFLIISVKTIYEFDKENQSLTIILKKIFRKNVIQEYSFDKIKQVKLDTNYNTNFNRGRIILEFNPNHDYPIDEYADAESGESNFQIIKDFLDDCKKKSK